MINKFKRKINKRGFTLIETLIAVFILATSIAAPLTIASRGLNNATTAKNQITAFYLAQDAIEYVRFARDSNRLAGRLWLGDATNPATDLSSCVGASGCYFDSTLNASGPNGGVPTGCSTFCSTPLAANSKYFYYSTTGFYWYNNVLPNVRQPFVRKVTLTAVSPDDPNNATNNEYLLTVSVYWSDVAVVHNVTVSENLFDWQ